MPFYIKLAITVEENQIQSILDILSIVAVNVSTDIEEPILKHSTKDKTVPDDFYSTTNHHTEVYLNKAWKPVQNIRMDAVLVVKNNEAFATKLRDIKKNDLIVCTSKGVRVITDKQDSEQGFAFMINDVSSERRVELAVRELAKEMKEIRERNGKIYFVAGPVVIHTGGMVPFQEIIRKGYVSGLLSGNAMAVHDIEYDIYGTSYSKMDSTPVALYTWSYGSHSWVRKKNIPMPTELKLRKNHMYNIAIQYLP